MAKNSTLNLEVPAKPAAQVATATTPRPHRHFLSVGTVPNRLIAVDSVVAAIGNASAHCELLLDNGERIGTRYEAQEIAQCIHNALGESLVSCGGRKGFFPDTHFIRISAIMSFSPFDDRSSKVWFGISSLVVPMAYEQLEASLHAAFDLTVIEPKRLRVAQPTVPERDLYTGSEQERYLDRVHGNTWERMGLPVPGRQ